MKGENKEETYKLYLDVQRERIKFNTKRVRERSVTEREWMEMENKRAYEASEDKCDVEH